MTNRLKIDIRIGDCELILKKGDITEEAVDVIVNAANPALSPGGGVCGAIHRAAGPELAAACAGLGGCKTGMAKLTPAYALPASYVIHTVGPVYRSYQPEEAARFLASCYRESLNLAIENNLKSIAFPAISTGIYGYPIELAAKVSLAAIINFLKIHGKPEIVKMILFSEGDLQIYGETYAMFFSP